MDQSNLGITTLDYFIHIRVITGMIISLSMSRVLLALVHYVQYPQKYPVSIFHICWLVIYSLFIVDWWWDLLVDSENIVFAYGPYFLAIMYSFTFYFGTALITPTELPNKMNFNEYFMGIKGWFYGVFFINILIDYFEDFLWSGPNDFIKFEAAILLISAVTLSIAAISKRLKTQMVIAAITLGLQLTLILLEIF